MAHGITASDSMMSVREMPWHGLGVVLDKHPETIYEALTAAGLDWQVEQGEVYVVNLKGEDNAQVEGVPMPLQRADDWRANIREDTGDILGIVSDDYKIVKNQDAFMWLNELLGGEVQFETAGSLHGGKRVWILARIPEMVEVGGDETATYIYAANSHDGSLAVTAAATKIRIVCANTLGWALRGSEGSPRTYKFRHTGDMQEKLGEARRVMGIVLDWDAAFKKLGDELAQQPISARKFDSKVVRPLLGMDAPDMGDRAKQNRQDNREILLNIMKGEGPAGDTSGNAPGTKWAAANAVAEFADWQRRYTKNTDQVARSFEDQNLKQTGLDLVLAA